MSNATTQEREDAPTDARDLVSISLFSDGLICLEPDGTICSANSEALSMLGVETLETMAIAASPIQAEGWGQLVEAVKAGVVAELPLRTKGGRSVLARLRRGAGLEHVSLIILVDVESFKFAQDRAFGNATRDNVLFIGAHRTRPDFATQRRLSPELHRVLSRGEVAIRHGARILIGGESGVGKSEIARFLHLSVADARDPFIVVNCAAASPDKPLDVALFGHDRPDGTRKAGLVDQAEGGTLFLDEVAEIPLSVQSRLLWFLEDGRNPGAGGSVRRSANVRIIAATNRDLPQMVRDGKFRADLYFRLAVVTLHVPPLRDMPPVVSHLIDRFQQTMNQRRVSPIEIPERVRGVLTDYSFPGNIRELLNIIQRIAVFIEMEEDIDELISDLVAAAKVQPADDEDDLPDVATLDLRSEVQRFERALIDKAIRVHGSKRKAAKALGVNIGTIVRKTTEGSQEDVVNP